MIIFCRRLKLLAYEYPERISLFSPKRPRQGEDGDAGLAKEQVTYGLKEHDKACTAISEVPVDMRSHGP